VRGAKYPLQPHVAHEGLQAGGSGGHADRYHMLSMNTLVRGCNCFVKWCCDDACGVAGIVCANMEWMLLWPMPRGEDRRRALYYQLSESAFLRSLFSVEVFEITLVLRFTVKEDVAARESNYEPIRTP
jgi:hypothetical protein